MTKLTSPDAVSGGYYDDAAAGRMTAAKSWDPTGVRAGSYQYERSTYSA